jgi:hypothetical protein
MKAIIKQEIEISPDIKEGDKVIFKYDYDDIKQKFDIIKKYYKYGEV